MEHPCLDGFARVSEYAEYQKEINQKFLCITDHGVMGAIPQQVAESEKHNLFPLFGVELYVNPMQPKFNSRAESAEFRKHLGDEALQKKFDKSHHLLGIAYNDVGYSNLVRLTSWAWIHGYYRRPRVNHEVLMQYKEGIIFTSTCGNSEIGNAFMGTRILNEDRSADPENSKYKVVYNEDAGMAMVEKYIGMFGEHFYLELMMLDWSQQKPYDEFLIRAHAKYNIPLILTQDCHFCRKEHSHNQRLMLMQQSKRTLAEMEEMIANGEAEDIFELQDTNLWLKSEDELNNMWEFKFQNSIDYELFKQAKANTVKIAEFAKGVQIDREIKLPKIPDADVVLWEEILKGFKTRNCPKTPAYIKRIREEYDLISEKGFSSYFLIQKMMVDEARKKGPEILGFGDGSEAVGPGRGCLHPLTPVRLDNGTVCPIGQIKPGDRVFTVDGSSKEVQKVMVYPLNNESLLNIKTYYGDYFGVPLTADHKVYAERQEAGEEPKGNCEWIEAGKLNVGDWCFVPIPVVQESESFEFDLPNMEMLFDSLHPNYMHNAETKHVPDCIINAPLNIVEHYLSGYFMADGHEDQYKAKFETVSPILAEQIRFLLLRLGIPSSITLDTREDSRAEFANRKPSYVITCPLDRRIGTSRDFSNKYGWKRVPGGIMLRIHEISEIQDVKQVCDIQVEGNHNYLTSSFLVHNSVCGSLVAYCLRLHDVEPIIHDLRFSRFLSPARGGKQQKFRHTIQPLGHQEIIF